MRSGLISCGLLLSAALAISLPALAQENSTQTRMGLKLSGDQPIQIESDKLEVNEKDSRAVFSGNVSVVQGTTMLKTVKMTVFYVKPEQGKAPPAGQQAIERLEVDGKVYVKSEAQEATGDHGTFDMKTEVLTLTGEKVVLSEGPNVLMGCKLTVQMKTGEANFEPCSGQRVRTLLTPGSQSQQSQ
ncbi:MAG TPA: LptA/OstA family protein [Mesorhizobium sp.]|jgi:lipopolysaccharide export system protein LptA